MISKSLLCVLLLCECFSDIQLYFLNPLISESLSNVIPNMDSLDKSNLLMVYIDFIYWKIHLPDYLLRIFVSVLMNGIYLCSSILICPFMVLIRLCWIYTMSWRYRRYIFFFFPILWKSHNRVGVMCLLSIW